MNYESLISKTDKDLVDLIAETWIKGGGDVEGLLWCIDAIAERVEKRIEQDDH
jgi:hypothetical protein